MLPALAKEPCGPRRAQAAGAALKTGNRPPPPTLGSWFTSGFRKWLRPTALFNNNLLGSLHGRLDRRCRKITNPLIPRKLERREGLGCTRGSDKRATLSQRTTLPDLSMMFAIETSLRRQSGKQAVPLFTRHAETQEIQRALSLTIGEILFSFLFRLPNFSVIFIHTFLKSKNMRQQIIKK